MRRRNQGRQSPSRLTAWIRTSITARRNYLRGRTSIYCFADLRHLEPDSRFDDVEAIVPPCGARRCRPGGARAGPTSSTRTVAETARLLEYARRWPKLRRVVLAGSFSIYGSNYTYTCPQCGASTDGTRQESDLRAGRYEVYCPGCGAEAEIVAITEDAVPRPAGNLRRIEVHAGTVFPGLRGLPGKHTALLVGLRSKAASSTTERPTIICPDSGMDPIRAATERVRRRASDAGLGVCRRCRRRDYPSSWTVEKPRRLSTYVPAWGHLSPTLVKPSHPPTVCAAIRSSWAAFGAETCAIA